MPQTNNRNWTAYRLYKLTKSHQALNTVHTLHLFIYSCTFTPTGQRYVYKYFFASHIVDWNVKKFLSGVLTHFYEL